MAIFKSLDASDDRMRRVAALINVPPDVITNLVVTFSGAAALIDVSVIATLDAPGIKITEPTEIALPPYRVDIADIQRALRGEP